CEASERASEHIREVILAGHNPVPVDAHNSEGGANDTTNSNHLRDFVRQQKSVLWGKKTATPQEKKHAGCTRVRKHAPACFAAGAQDKISISSTETNSA